MVLRLVFVSKVCAGLRLFRRSAAGKSKTKSSGGEFVDLSRRGNAAAAPPAAPAAAAAPAAVPKAGFLEGLLGKAQAAFPEADVLARMQVKQINIGVYLAVLPKSQVLSF